MAETTVRVRRVGLLITIEASDPSALAVAEKAIRSSVYHLVTTEIIVPRASAS